MYRINKSKIAIVDDEKVGATILSERLSSFGLEISYFECASSFLETLDSDPPDLILLDIMMKEVNGIDALKEIRKKFDSIELPIIMLTSKNSKTYIIETLKLGANDYILKPVEIDIAIARIKSLLFTKYYHTKNLHEKESDTLKSIVTTYNHEINNPLTIALANLESDISKMTDEKLAKAHESVLRISEIVKSIQGLLDGKAVSTSYGHSGSQFELNKDKK